MASSSSKKVKVSKAISCEPCRRSKVRCCKSFPCARCVRLGYECEDPQIAAAAAAAAAQAALDDDSGHLGPRSSSACSSSPSSAEDGECGPWAEQQLPLLPPRSPSGMGSAAQQQQQCAAPSEPAGAKRGDCQPQLQPPPPLPHQQIPLAPAQPANGAGETIHELMHVGREVDLTQPRRPPMMEASLPVSKDKAMCFLVTMALVHQRRGMTSKVVEHIVRTISQALGMEMGALGPLLPSTAPGPSNFQCFVHGCVENAVHPYCKAFYTDAFATFSWVTIGGNDRIYVNRPFAELFHSEEELNEELDGGQSSPRAMVLRSFHASDRDEVDRLLDYCFFISGEECSEAVHVLRCQSYKTGRSFMALVRFRSATWHKGWYYCGTLSVQPMPLPVSLFACRDSWWHLARAPESGRLSSTGALLQHGDAIFLDPAARQLNGSSRGRKRPRGQKQQPTLHAQLMWEGEEGGGGRGLSASGSVASSLSALELYGEPFALEDGGGGGGGDGSGSGSDADGEEEEEEEERPEVFVPGQWPADSDWPRLETKWPLALPAPGGVASTSTGSLSSASSSSSGAQQAPAAAPLKGGEGDARRVTVTVAAPVVHSGFGGAGDGKIHSAPACLRLGEVSTMSSGAWAPGGAVLPPLPPHAQGGLQRQAPAKQQSIGEEKEHAPDAAAASAMVAATAAAAALAAPPARVQAVVGRGGGGGMAVTAPSAYISTAQQQPPHTQGMVPMRVYASASGGAYQPQRPPPPQQLAVSMYYHHEQQQQLRAQAMAGGANGAGGMAVVQQDKITTVAGYTVSNGSGAVMLPSAVSSPRGGYGGGEEGLGEDDGLLDLLCESPLLFDSNSFQGPPAAPAPSQGQGQGLRPQEMGYPSQQQPQQQQPQYQAYQPPPRHHHYQQPAPPASMGMYMESGPPTGAPVVGTWGPSA